VAPPSAPGPAGQRVPAGPEANGPEANGPGAGGPGAGEPGGLVRPGQLPASARHFAGRSAELKVAGQFLEDALDPGCAAGGAVAILAISGSAGVGKTALAVHWAHQVADRFPDGQLYVDLRGYGPSGPPVTENEAILGFLGALGVPPWQVPAGPEARAGLYRSLLARRRMLVVADNARDAAQVRPLLPGSGRCLVVVTSRDQLGGLVAANGALPLSLDVFSTAEAAEFLAARLGGERIAAEPDCAGELIARCARLPLALAIAAARAAARPEFALSAVTAELRVARERLDVLDPGDARVDLRTVFSWSWLRLSEPAARLFCLLSVHPGPDVAAAAALAGISPAQAGLAMRELARASLLTEPFPGRYAHHDLLRSYAAEQAAAGAGDRAEAARRMIDYYLYSARAGALRLNRSRVTLALPAPGPGVVPERFADPGTATAWFEAEREVLLAAVDQAAGSAFAPRAWQLAVTLGPYLDGQGRWPQWQAVLGPALAAAERCGDRLGQARVRRDLALAQARLGSFPAAYRHLRLALSLSRQLGDLPGQAHAHQDLARVADWQGRLPAALRHALRLRSLMRAAGDRGAEARALNDVGWTHAHLGAYQEALDCCQEALAVLTELDDQLGQAITWDSLGFARHQLGQHTAAIDCYARALALYRQLGHRHRQAETLAHAGDAYLGAGDPAAARDAWRQALGIHEDLPHPGAEPIRARLDAVDRPAPQRVAGMRAQH
jgi:tetratricopeptide (TPR) repeat protein